MPARILGNVTTASISGVKPRVSVSVVDPVVGVQASVAASHVAYILMTPSAYLDTTGQFKYIPELVVISDTVALAVDKAFSDSVGAETEQVVFDTLKGLSDSVSFTEVFLATLVFLRDFSDSTTVPDAVALSFAKALTDNFAVSDATARSFSKFLASGFAMNDSFDANDGSTYVFSKGVTNVVFVPDAQTKTVDKALTDTASVADALAVVFSKAVADVISTSATLSVLFEKALADSFGTQDAATKFFDKSADPDSVSAADATTLSPTKGISDMIEPVDAGSLLSQGYCDITYFAEDYVGESRTFS
jgi:hypothetical protein